MGLNDCDRTRERVSLELDGELSPHELTLLDRHLAGCPDCAAFASNVARCADLLRSAPLEQPPAFMLPRRRPALRLSLGVGAAVASTAAAALVALSSTQPSGDHQRAAALGFAPSTAFVEHVQGGIVGLRHPKAAQVGADPRPTLGLPQVASQQELGRS
jgi:anti-sigma factor RsiW